MSFTFGCARDLYRRNIHPRVLCGPGDIDRLRRQIRRGDGLRLMRALRTKLNPLVRLVLDSDDLPKLLDFYGTGVWRGTGWKLSMALRDMALMGVLDDNDDAIEAARRIALDRSPGSAGNLGWCGMGAIGYDIMHDRLSAADRLAFVTAVAADVRKQVADGKGGYFRNSGANTPIGTHMLQPLVVLLSIQGDEGAGDLFAELGQTLKYLEASLQTAYNVDGYPEEDIGYGTDVAGGMAWAVEGARRAGLYDAYDPRLGCANWSRLGRALVHFVQPWGEYLSMTGDHPNVFWNREMCLARIAAQTRDPVVRWLLGSIPFTLNEFANNPLADFHIELPLRKGFQVPVTSLSLLVLDELKPGTHPAKAKVPTAFCDRGRGIVSFRSSWKDDATYVVFDGSHRSPSAQGHFHASCGDFMLTALGDYFAIGGGRYSGEQCDHNVTLIDGKSGRPNQGEWIQTSWHGNLTSYSPGAFCDTASVDSSHQHNCRWAKRTLGLVKGEHAPAYVWTVDDINKADDFAEFWWTLNTSPENTIQLRDNWATITGWRKGNHLDVHFALPDPKSFPKPHTLTMAQDEPRNASYKYIPDAQARVADYARPAAMVNGIVFVRPRLIGKVAGYNGRFMSVMLPRRKGAKPAKVKRLPTIDNTLALRLTFDKVEDTLIWSYEHCLLEAGDVIGRGRWCVVRRLRSSGKVIDYAIAEGTRLSVSGKELAMR